MISGHPSKCPTSPLNHTDRASSCSANKFVKVSLSWPLPNERFGCNCDSNLTSLPCFKMMDLCNFPASGYCNQLGAFTCERSTSSRELVGPVHLSLASLSFFVSLLCCSCSRTADSTYLIEPLEPKSAASMTLQGQDSKCTCAKRPIFLRKQLDQERVGLKWVLTRRQARVYFLVCIKNVYIFYLLAETNTHD